MLKNQNFYSKIDFSEKFRAWILDTIPCVYLPQNGRAKMLTDENNVPKIIEVHVTNCIYDVQYFVESLSFYDTNKVTTKKDKELLKFIHSLDFIDYFSFEDI
jgi:hypothetical protein